MISPQFYRHWPRVFIAVLVLAGCLMGSGCGLLNTAVGVGLIKVRFGCLVEGTRLDTPSGSAAVEDLRTGDVVVGYDGEAVVVQQVHQYQEDPMMRRHLAVSFSNGAEIQLSELHRIAGVPAGRLAVGDEVGGVEVVAVRSIDGVSRSFDLLTDDRGYRIEGIPVNSMIDEMAGR